jgi:hypothetical protein
VVRVVGWHAGDPGSVCVCVGVGVDVCFFINPWHLTTCADLSKAVVITEAGTSRDAEVVQNKVTNIHRLVTACRG